MPARIDRLPVTLVTGFLGSGKTTLLARLLRDPAFSATAVLVNELGAVGLDHHVLGSATETTRVLENGCVCCTVREDLAAALATLYWDRLHRRVPRFDRVVVETTGLADPAPVLQLLHTSGIVAERYRAASVVCTVDGVAGLAELATRAEAARQAAVADVLLLTKADLVGAADRAALDQALARLNPVAPRHAIAHGAAPKEAVRTMLGAPERAGRRYRPAVQAVALHASDVTTFVVDVPPVARDVLAAALGELARRFEGVLLRAKGAVVVEGEARPLAVHVVQQTVYPFVALPELAAARASALVFILAAPEGSVRASAEAAIRARLAEAFRRRANAYDASAVERSGSAL